MGKIPFDTRTSVKCCDCMYAEIIENKKLFCNIKNTIVKKNACCGMGISIKNK